MSLIDVVSHTLVDGAGSRHKHRAGFVGAGRAEQARAIGVPPEAFSRWGVVQRRAALQPAAPVCNHVQP